MEKLPRRGADILYATGVDADNEPPNERHSKDGVAGEDMERLLALSRPEFKTFVTNGGRAGIRLEAAFWHALHIVGRQGGATTGRSLAVDVLSLARQMGINATSALRCVIVSRLLAALEQASRAQAADQLLKLLQAAPVPAFAFDRSLRIVRCNTEFRRYLAATAGTGVARARPEDARLVLDRPVSALPSEAGIDAIQEESIVICIGTNERRVTARLMVVKQEAEVVVQAYILHRRNRH
ncbi:ribbon-helix-helix domain-containing protein [Pseudochelatococcus sp. B33]